MIPPLYPDELVSSGLTRAVIRSGLPPCRLLGDISPNRRASMSRFIPGQLREIAAVLGTSPETLLWEHTPFPYAVAFMRPDEVRRLERAILSGYSARRLGSIFSSVTTGLPKLRFCPECCREDELTYGESYWRRLHNLPSSLTCIKHGIGLSDSEVNAGSSWQSDAIQLPEHQAGTDIDALPPASVSLVLATATWAALERTSTHRTDWPDIYRSASVAQGYATCGGRLASSQIALDLTTLYGDTLLNRLGVKVTERRAWPSVMVRGATQTLFAPIKHVLLQGFLASVSSEAKSSSRSPPGPRAPDWQETDAKAAKKVRARTRRLLAKGKQSTAARILLDVGMASRYHHDRRRFPLTEAALADFLVSPAAKRRRAAPGSVERIQARRTRAATQRHDESTPRANAAET